MNRLLLLLLSLFVLSCGSSDTTESADETGSEETAVMEAADAGVPMSGPNYSIAEVDSEPSSPRMEMTGTIEGTNITVNYGSPSVKGRTIWGDLEPYDQVWRAGANEATRVTFDKDVLVEGAPLSAGTYSYFAIPSAGAWTVIFNNTAEQWGAFDYAEDQDALRVEVEPIMEQANQEMLSYYIDGNDLVLRWEKVALPVEISAAEQ